MTKGEKLVKIYDLGRDVGMTHLEAMEHAKIIVGMHNIEEQIDSLYASAYIAIRDDYPKHLARDLAKNYTEGLMELAASD